MLEVKGHINLKTAKNNPHLKSKTNSKSKQKAKRERWQRLCRTS